MTPRRFLRSVPAMSLLVLFACRGAQRPGPAPAQNPAPAVGAAPTAAPSPDAMAQMLPSILGAYRKIIVLLESEDSMSPEDRDRASLVGKIIFHENQQRLATLSELLAAEAARAGGPGAQDRIVRFLDYLDSPELRAADALAFSEVTSDLAAALRTSPLDAETKRRLETRVEADRKAIAEIKAGYEKELEKIFGRFDTRGL